MSIRTYPTRPVGSRPKPVGRGAERSVCAHPAGRAKGRSQTSQGRPSTRAPSPQDPPTAAPLHPTACGTSLRHYQYKLARFDPRVESRPKCGVMLQNSQDVGMSVGKVERLSCTPDV
ncbi:hypothetical protein M8818_000480 [Zalaria obscura]|uniref:Uncharacterized protein n=1 Tax=Zalaria obscura TaxID=2024903 RepID=A0ACC3SN13_9PEZI